MEHNVVSSSGMNMSAGPAAPYLALYAMIDTGMMVSPEVLSVRNIIIELLAVSFFVFMLVVVLFRRRCSVLVIIILCVPRTLLASLV